MSSLWNFLDRLIMETPIYKLFEIIPENIIDGLNGINATTKEWAGYEYTVKSSYGNIELIAENIYSFVEHNYLPVEGRSLDGHLSDFSLEMDIVTKDNIKITIAYVTPDGKMFYSEKLALAYLQSISNEKENN